ncbi:MAG: hypothetical protein E7350_00630 [Clostridiales bacterium]|nr:hypothetical protein [Clostridiales bacterium]
MAKKEKQKDKKPLLYRFIFWLFTVFYKKRRFIGKHRIEGEAVIVVGNHAQTHAPLTSELYFPAKKAIWCIGEMTKAKEVPAYAYQDFWSLKPKWTRWFYKLLSYIMAPLCGYIFSNADTIAVYKDARLMSTFKSSVKALSEGKKVVLFPENRECYNEIINDFQDKFVAVAKLYYSRYKVCPTFVPMYNAPELKAVIFGKPIRYDPNIDIDEQCKIVCNHLKKEITRIARLLPRHRVVPYANISKKDYPYSK